MSHLSRPPRGQQRDKPYREALRMELAAAGEDVKKLREIARTHIEKAAAGDMQASRRYAVIGATGPKPYASSDPASAAVSWVA